MSKEKIKDFELLSPFGPKIGKFNLPKKVLSNFNKLSKKVLKDRERSYNSELVGEIAEEWHVSPSYYSEYQVDSYLDKAVTEYTKNCIYANSGGLKRNYRIKPIVQDGWVNEMKSYEYNPVHFHTSKPPVAVHFSSVLYLEIPEITEPICDLYKDKTDNVNSQKEINMDGKIEFIGSSIPGGQAESLLHEKSSLSLIPKVGQFFIFPYYLLHTVYPFISEKNRLSLAINFGVNVYNG